MRFNAYVDVDYWLEKLFASFYIILVVTFLFTFEPLSRYLDNIPVLSISMPLAVLGITVIFLVIFLLYLDFNYIEISEKELRFKWFGGEKSVKIDDISSFHHLGELGFIAPLYKVDKIRVFTTTIIVVNTGITSSVSLFKISPLIFVAFIILLLSTIISIFLPAHIGRKVFAGFIFSDAGYLLGVLLIQKMKPNTLVPIIIMAMILIIAFFIGYYLGSGKRWIYDYIIIKALMNDKEKTIIVNGRVKELTKFKDELIKVMRNVKTT